MEHVQKNKRLYSFLLVLCLVCNLFTGIPAAEAAESDLLSAIPSQTISTTPAQITLSIAKDENGSAMAFNWVVTDTSSTEGKSNLVYSENPDMSDAVIVSAQRKDPDGDDIETDTETEWGVFENVHAYSAEIYDLKAGKTYYYQVGNETDGYTETASFKAPDKNTDSFSFVVSADTQSNTKAGYNNTRELYNYIAEQESNAAFLIHTGDIVEDGNVSVQWEWFFEAAKKLLCSIPMMTTPGNHESGHHDKNLVNFKAHTNFETLTAPEGLSENAKGTVYSFEYGNALFICLNTAAGSADDKIQFEFLRQQVEQTNKKWKIVFMHIPPYDPGKNHYSVDNETGKLLSDAGVDLVLSGHEHAYARNTLLTTDAGIKEAEPGNAPTYVIGGSVMNAAYDRNSKSDLWSQTFVELRKPSGSGIYAPGVYASVDVKEDSLTYTAYYKADGENFSAIDTFTINKNGNSEEPPVEKKPLEIDSAEDLVTLSKMDISDRDIILTKDIDMEGLEFTPLNGSVLYNGIFDGQGHVIKNLSISNTGKNCTGLIGCVGLDGTVKNLGLENVSITGANSTGGITGALLGTVSSCYVTGEISGAKNVGGVTGILHAGTIENCWTDAVVTASSYGGGLFGCTDYRGTNGKEEDPSVLMQNGFTGRVTDRGHKVINNLVMGETKGSTSAMIGDWSGGKGSSCNVFDGNVLWLDSVATEKIYGWISGNAQISEPGYENVYCETPTLKIVGTGNGENKINVANFTSRTAEQLGEQAAYEALGWDFETVWAWDENLEHPNLQLFMEPQVETVKIKTADDLVALSKRSDISNVNIKLENDIDMTGKSISPIGGSLAYNGTFDGKGNVIKNLTISNANGNCTGLIGYVGLDGTVKNLGLENVSITGANSTGGITGALLGTVSSCYVTGEISGAKNVGGVTGILHAGTIENCWTDAEIIASSYGGGLFGCTDYRGTNGKEEDPSVLMQNGFTGPVTDRKHKVINNLVMGETKGSTSAMIGDWSGSKGSKCNVFDGNVLWLDSVATGNIYGYVSSSAQISTAGCENVYCVTPALTVDTANIANFTSRTAAQLGEQNTYESLGWDFKNIWTWSAALGHPVLKNVTVPAEPYEPKPDNSVQFASLVTTFAGDAKTSRAFTWHTNTNINKSAVQAIEKKNYKDETSFSGSNVISTTGTVTTLQTSADGEKRNVHHANLTGLTAGTQYYYRVGDGESVWSDIYTFTTEAEDTEEFTFYHITDTQASSGIYKNYKSILDAVTKSNSEGAFILHSGDVMQNNQTSHYDAVYKMIADYTSWLPSMVTPGNHELEKDLDKAETNSAYAVENPNYVKGVENFKSHYMYPDNGPANSKQLVYSFDYGNAHFAILNSNNVNGSATTGLDDMTKQIAWLKTDMNASDKTWKIVSVHVGPYNTYGTSLTSLANALDELGVDVVFFGHNHVFMRSNAIKGGEIKALNQDGSVDAESGTVYYSSGSAGGSGTINEKGKKWFAATKSSSYPTYGVIKVTEDSLTINTYELQNEEKLIDTVTIKKNIQESDKPVQSVQLPRSVTYLWETADKKDGTFLARFNWIMDADETAPSYLFYAEKDNYEKTGKLEQIAAKVTTVDLTDKLNAKGYKNGTANYKGEAGAKYCYAPVKSYKAETPALKPNTEYVYCVGADISDSNSVTALQTIKTPAADTDTFNFLFFTDAQQGACGSYEKTLKEYETLTKTLNQAVKDYPDAAFILSGGDQVNYGIDTWEWDAFFASSQDVFSRYPLYLSTGNHECDGAPDWAADGKWTPVDQTCSAVLGRYNPPENGVAYYGGGKDGTSPVLTSGDAYEESKAGNYYFIYGDTLFLVMDFQDTSAKGLTEAQQEWLKTVVENNPAKWKVAVMHKTLFGYRVGDPTAGVWRTWSDTFDEAGIDLVLMGHDHVYTRTKYYSDGAVTNPQEDGSGTTYITSSSANDGGRSDRYNPNAYTLVNSTDHYDQSYIGISISPKEIRVTSKGFDAEEKLVTVENNALVTDTPRSMYKADTETEQKAYQLNVTGGMIQNIEGTTAEITAGTEVTVTALVPEGQEFVSWTVSGLEGIDINSQTLTFQMPEHDVMLSATFRTVDSDDTDSDDTGSDDTGSNGNSSGSSSGGGFSGVYNYPVKLAGADGANVTLSDSYAVAGEIVTITISPDRGKQVAEVIITDASGNAVSSKKIANNQYSFTMPANTVNVDVILKDANYDLRIVMQINSKNILQNTDYVTSDVAPVIVDNRTMVPIRIVTELLGGTADWDAETRTVTLQINGKILSMGIDEEIPGFGTSAVIIDSRTYVPIRYVAEKLGANVEWIEAAQQIVIEK